MEKEWPPYEECVQYKLGLLGPYLQNFAWEHDDGDETQYEYQMEHDSSHKVEIEDDSESSDEDEDEIEVDSSHKVEIEVEDKDDSDSSHKVDSSHGIEDEDNSSDEEGEDWAFPPRFRKFSYKPSTLRKFVKQVRESRGYDVDVDGLPHFMCNRFFPFNEYDMLNQKDLVNAGVELAIKKINSKTGKVYKHVDTLAFVFCNRVFLLTFTAKVIADKEVDAETFLATVYSAGCSFKKFKLLECLLKPEGPAPWSYVDRPYCPV